MKQMSFKSFRLKSINWRYISNKKGKIVPLFRGSRIKRSITKRGKRLAGMLTEFNLQSFQWSKIIPTPGVFQRYKLGNVIRSEIMNGLKQSIWGTNKLRPKMPLIAKN